MKRKIITMLGIISIVMGLAACGQVPANGEDSSADSTVSDAVSEKEESSEEKTVELSDEELPYWRGVYNYLGYSFTQEDGSSGHVGIDIQFPSLVPTSGGWAYQLDPTYVFVTSPGLKDGERIVPDSLEDTFEASRAWIYKRLESSRGGFYADFDFIIETEEPLTINDFPMYKYTGTHTYTYKGEQRECDFVAYCVDSKQTEHAYFTFIVMDDSLNNPSMDPVPEGTIEAYARKMAESIILDTYS